MLMFVSEKNRPLLLAKGVLSVMHNNIASTEAVPGHIDERLKLAPENKR